MTKVIVEVMTSGQALKRTMNAWRKSMRGEACEPTIGVPSVMELLSLLSPKRLELLRYVAENPGRSIRSLAKGLRRDYKNVHADVAHLTQWHLLLKDENGITAPFDEIVIKGRAQLRNAA